MIEVMDESAGAFVALRATGKLRDTDYKTTLIPMLEKKFAEHGKLDLLFLMDEGFEGWDLRGAWDDASFGLRHAADFRRLAVVGGPDWVHWCIKASRFLMKGEVRIFPPDQRDAAMAWVRG